MLPLTVVVATLPGRERQRFRAFGAYNATSPQGTEIVISEAGSYPEAWRSAELSRSKLVHFASDQLEPHPGWFEAGQVTVAGRRAPAAVLWSPAGEPNTWARDWSPAWHSEFALLGWEDAREALKAPSPGMASRYSFVTRRGYAFTLWPD